MCAACPTAILSGWCSLAKRAFAFKKCIHGRVKQVQVEQNSSDAGNSDFASLLPDSQRSSIPSKLLFLNFWTAVVSCGVCTAGVMLSWMRPCHLLLLLVGKVIKGSQPDTTKPCTQSLQSIGHRAWPPLDGVSCLMVACR